MRSRLALVLGLAALASAAPAAEAATWLADAGAAAGYFTAGGYASCAYRFPFGLTLGIEADPVAEILADPVAGLSGGSTFYLSGYASAGWDLPLGRSFALRASLMIGAEASFLRERIVDPAHGIDTSYSTQDFMFDPAGKIGVAWFPLEKAGLCLSLVISMYDLRKSLAELGAAFRL